MQASFLSLCAEHILKKCGEDSSSACIVFPTRRAALFFRKELAKHITKPVFAPEILSIHDFAEVLSPVKTSDNITLLFKLFKSYKEEFPLESFHHYLHWGEMMLRDFHEIDMECVDAEKLFAAVKEWKEVESRFEWEPEELAAIRMFWNEFSLHEHGLLQQSFLETWKSIPSVYRHFYRAAQSDQFASESMAWKNALHAAGQAAFLLRWNKIFFCGFYFMERIHQKLTDTLKQLAFVEFLYDADSYYTNDLFQEAGTAFRKLREPFLFKGDYFSSHPKTITITGVPMGEMQVKTAGQILREWMKDGTGKSTAVVLPDEKLLLPLLNSLSEDITSFNVTMGFPAQHTVTGSFIRSLYDLHTYSHSGSEKFYSLLLIPVLTHPGLPVAFREHAAALHNQIFHSQFGWISNRQVKEHQLDDLFLYKSKSSVSMLDYLLRILRLISETDNVFESSVAAFMHEKFSEIKPLMDEPENEMDDAAAWKVVMKIIRSLRIPFSGEPVAGIQIMGMLETRALDFDRVIILSVNEGVLPGNSLNPSFIPFSLRRAFGMPVTEHHDAVYAYHFYRLLQRASEVHLIYDTEGKQFSGGEMSRFTNQLINEAEKKSEGKCRIIHRVVTAPLTVITKEKIVISKSQEMMEAFRKKISESENGLSASALTSYIACKLRFYFRYIAGLKEPDKLNEIPGPEVLGNLLHHAMEFLYGDKKLVSSLDIQAMKSGINEAVNVAFGKVFPHPDTEETGYNFLNKQILRKLVAAILETDAARIPFEIKGLEEHFESTFTGGLKAGGVIDRLQVKENTLEILDYKSGKAELTADLEKVFTNPDTKATFQLLYYGMLMRKQLKNIPFKAGLYVMKQLSGGISFLNDGEIISDELMVEFEKKLNLLLDEIFDPSFSFTQTKDLRQCAYCPYVAICKR